MQQPREFRQKVYDYVEELLGRPLTYEEHDDLRDMMQEYVFSVQNLRAATRRIFCIHEWVSDKKVESGGAETRVHVKCIKCDKRTLKRMPTISYDV